ncbi:MAG: ankyrin repeat domain-containing protein, partial [Candidatus Paceibacterota bacterium]
MIATDDSSLYKLCALDTGDMPATRSLLSSASASTLTRYLSYRDLDGCTPLLAACRNGQHQIVEMLLVAGANKETPSQDGWTPLHHACLYGH